MNMSDEGAKQPADVRSVARSISTMMLTTAVESASGVLNEWVGDGVSAMIHMLLTTLTKIISSDAKVQAQIDLKETIDV
jgi:hypothetical protein